MQVSVGPGQERLKTMGDPQRGAGSKHLWGCAKATIVLTRGRSPGHDIKLCQDIPPVPLLDGMDFHHALFPDGTLNDWRNAQELQHKVVLARQDHARGTVKTCITVGQPTVERLTNKVFGHTRLFSHEGLHLPPWLLLISAGRPLRSPAPARRRHTHAPAGAVPFS